MVLRVKSTPTWFPTNSLYTLAFYIKCVCHPWSKKCVVLLIIDHSLVHEVIHINSKCKKVTPDKGGLVRPMPTDNRRFILSIDSPRKNVEEEEFLELKKNQ